MRNQSVVGLTLGKKVILASAGLAVLVVPTIVGVLSPDLWAIHVPLGKLKTERWVPVDAAVYRIVERLRTLRSPTSTSDPFLLPRNRARETLIRRVRAVFRDAVAAVGIMGRLVPHQNRHTYATEMLRSGVGLPALMQLLGHASPEMTLRYL